MNHDRDRNSDTTGLEDATPGLIGVGKIGSKTAEKAKALNMRVLGLRRDPERSHPCADQMFAPRELHTLLPQSDRVVLTAALTAETRGMLGENDLKIPCSKLQGIFDRKDVLSNFDMRSLSRFKAMKKSAHIINAARGAVIQANALPKALRKGWIAGAVPDVFEKEPLDKDSPLWEMETVLIAPHMAGLSPCHVSR